MRQRIIAIVAVATAATANAVGAQTTTGCCQIEAQPPSCFPASNTGQCSGGLFFANFICRSGLCRPNVSPTPSRSRTPTRTPTPTRSGTATRSSTPSPSAVATATVTLGGDTATPTALATEPATRSPEPAATETATALVGDTPTVLPTEASTLLPSVLPTETPPVIGTETATPVVTATALPASATATASATDTATPADTPTSTPTDTPALPIATATETAPPTPTLDRPAIGCACYWSHVDCPDAGTPGVFRQCAVASGGGDTYEVEAMCRWTQPRHLCTGEVEIRDGKPIREGCDGVCSPVGRVGTPAGRPRDPAPQALIEAVVLWTQATTEPAETGGGPLSAALASEALALPFRFAHPRQIARDMLSLMAMARGESFFFHPADPHLEEHLAVADLSNDFCRLEAGNLAALAMVAELGQPGTGRPYVDQLSEVCAELPIAGPCAGAPEPLACLAEVIGAWADLLVAYESPVAGDATCDGAVTAADLPSLVRLIGLGGALTPCGTDADGSGAADSGDVSAVVGRVFE